MSSIRKRVVRYASGRRTRTEDELAVEEPLEIRLDTQPLVVTMRTPGHDEELAAGFLYTEGLILNHADLKAVRRNPRNRSGNSVDVFLNASAPLDTSRLARRGYASSSCGLCGKESIEAVHRQFKRITTRLSVDPTILARLPELLRSAQPTFDRTGGLHAAGIFSAEGELMVAREDIGRHNAVDKVIGFGLLNDQLPFDRHILVVSGRASFEILQKAWAARLPIICAVSAPSSLAVEMARASGQTLVGFLRPGRMNIYAGATRVRSTARPGQA